MSTQGSQLVELRDKLSAGQKEKDKGIEKYSQAQFYDNLTKEQYTAT